MSAVLTATPDHTGGRELVVFSRRIGDYLTVQQHIAHLNEDSGGRISSGSVAIEESILPKPHNFPPSGLRVCFQVECSISLVLFIPAVILQTHSSLMAGMKCTCVHAGSMQCGVHKE